MKHELERACEEVVLAYLQAISTFTWRDERRVRSLNTPQAAGGGGLPTLICSHVNPSLTNSLLPMCA